MATGRLGVSAIPATTNTTVYTVPTGYYTVCNVSITNRNSTAIKVRVAMAAAGTPNAQEWLEYDTTIIGNGVFERTGLVVNAGLNIVVYSDTTNVGCTVYGIETSTT
jgi:hypothetical protein